jgi:hypothetical protein
MQDSFRDRVRTLVESNAQVAFANQIVRRWLGVRLDSLCVLVVGCIAVFAVRCSRAVTARWRARDTAAARRLSCRAASTRR